MSHTRLHDIWLTMRYRCEKPTYLQVQEAKGEA